MLASIEPLGIVIIGLLIMAAVGIVLLISRPSAR
jgi:hypothetical protein